MASIEFPLVLSEDLKKRIAEQAIDRLRRCEPVRTFPTVQSISRQQIDHHLAHCLANKYFTAQTDDQKEPAVSDVKGLKLALTMKDGSEFSCVIDEMNYDDVQSRIVNSDFLRVHYAGTWSRVRCSEILAFGEVDLP